MLVPATANRPLKYDVFLMALLAIHFVPIIFLVKLFELGNAEPIVILICGMLWWGLGFAKVTAWAVRHTPFGHVYNWAWGEDRRKGEG